jgi:GT2 family glycosyltransferase
MQVVVIIVNFNGEAFVANAINSALAQRVAAEHTVTVCVVDNASTDGSLGVLQSFGERITLLASPTNTGFSGGNNLAFNKYPQADVFALLNPDAHAATDWLAQSIRTAYQHGDWAMISPQILNAAKPSVIDNLGHRMFLDGTVRGQGRNQNVQSLRTQAEDVFIASGCAVLLKAEAVRRIGGFDAEFFCYCDDVELSLRLQLAGYRGYMCHAARVYHAFSSTAGGEAFSTFKAYHVERNRWWMVAKCFPAPLLPVAMAGFMARYVGALAVTFIAKRGPAASLAQHRGTGTLFSTIARAQRDALIGLPAMWRLRAVIQRDRKLSTTEFVRRWHQHYLTLADVLTVE